MKYIYTLSIACALSVIDSSFALAQPNDHNWSAEKVKTEQRLDSIKSLQANLQCIVYNSEAYRKSQKEVWGESFPDLSAKSPQTFDPNRTILYRWATDRERWRCEWSYVYPPITGYSLYIYDGEKFISRLKRDDVTIISGEPTFSEDALTKLAQSEPLGFRFLQFIKDFEDKIGVKTQFSYVEDNLVSGIKCAQYVFKHDEYSFSVSVDSATGLIAKYQTFYSGKESKGGFAYQVLSVSKVDGILMPTSIQIDAYTGDSKNMSRLWTKRYLLSSIRLNRSLTAEDFDRVIRVGEIVENRIEQPGDLKLLGQISEDDNVANGAMPSPLAID